MSKSEYLELISRHLKGETSEFEDHLLSEWLDENPVNKEEFEEFSKIWKVTKESGDNFRPDVEAAWMKVRGKASIPNNKTGGAKESKVRPLFNYIGVAAAILVLIVAGIVLVQNFGKESNIQLSTLETKKDFYLPDGSKVWLNRNSNMSYHKSFDNRIVYLDGEAFFEVKKVSGKSFTVLGPKSKIEVLGTSFNVKARQHVDIEEVEVVTGKVSFSKQESGKDTKVILTPGQKAVIGRGVKIEEMKIEDPNFLSWKNEKLIFENTSLADVGEDISEYFGVDVKITDKQLLNCRFTGTFENPGINELMEVLALSINLSYTQQGKDYVLTGKGCN